MFLDNLPDNGQAGSYTSPILVTAVEPFQELKNRCPVLFADPDPVVANVEDEGRGRQARSRARSRGTERRRAHPGHGRADLDLAQVRSVPPAKS